jgi:hypothetical protein
MASYGFLGTNDAATQQVMAESLLKWNQNRPKNTNLSYLPKQKEWTNWCQNKYPPVPENWPDLSWQGSLPGDLVDEGKMFLFMKEQVYERAPRTGPRVVAARKRKAEEMLKPEVLDDDEVIADLAVKVGYSTIEAYESAIIALYNEQRTLRTNLMPNPRGVALKALRKSVAREAAERRRTEYADKGDGTIKDVYAFSQVPDHTRAALGLKGQKTTVDGAVRTSVDFLLANSMLLRGEERLTTELADLFCIDLPKEGLLAAQGTQSTERAVKALVLLLPKTKTNQEGELQYGAALRHKDPFACPVGALALWFFLRWQVGHEPFPSFLRNEDWYRIRILRRSWQEPETSIAYTTHNEWTKKLYVACGIRSSKSTHLPRKAAAQNADKAGVPESQVSGTLLP